jgi:hypothetical protein
MTSCERSSISVQPAGIAVVVVDVEVGDEVVVADVVLVVVLD